MMDANKYQTYANSLLSRMQRADDVSVGQHYNPGSVYQARANYAFEHGGVHQTTADGVYTPMQHMADGWQSAANGMNGRMISADDLALNGLIRPSGSLARSLRGINTGCGTCSQQLLGDVATDTPLYKNPYVIAGGVGVLGLTAWLLLRKKRK